MPGRRPVKYSSTIVAPHYCSLIYWPCALTFILQVDRQGADDKETCMVDTLENLQKLCDDLKRQRDELQVKLHMAKAEARDEWARLEARWEEAKTKMNIVRRETSKTMRPCPRTESCAERTEKWL